MFHRESGVFKTSYAGDMALYPLPIAQRTVAVLAALFIVILSYDAWLGMWFTDAAGKEHFGIGVGTIVLTLNAVFLALYTFGCHSLRHLVGGRFELLSGFRHKTYDCVSCLNSRHQLWAWMSLFSVGISDIYVRLCATGAITDWRII